MTTEEQAALDKLRETLAVDPLRLEFGRSFSLTTGESFVSAGFFVKNGDRWKKADLPVLVAPAADPTRAGLLRQLADMMSEPLSRDEQIKRLKPVLEHWGVRSRHSDWTDEEARTQAAEQLLDALG